MASSLINEDVFRQQLLSRLNAELAKVAEPIVAKHLAAARGELEEAMRQRLGAMLVGMLEQNLSLYRNEHQLVITLNHCLPEKPHG